jgi:hypothetical protein
MGLNMLEQLLCCLTDSVTILAAQVMVGAMVSLICLKRCE